MHIVTAHTVGKFPATGSGAGNQLIIEPDFGLFFDDFVHLLISPVGLATRIEATVGTVQLGSVKPRPVAAGILQVSGGTIANLPRKVAYSSPAFRVLFAFDASTGADVTSSVSLKYDAQNNVLTLSRAVYCAISYTAYTSAGQELLYRPVVTNDGINGVTVEFGAIAAFAPPDNLTVYQPDGFNVDGENDIELYRIISKKVTTDQGQFERPPGFPTSGKYTTPPVAFELDLSVYLESERVHEVGRMRKNGDAYATQFNVQKLEPYVGNASYTIPTECVENSLDSNSYPKSLVLAAKAFIRSRGLGCK